MSDSNHKRGSSSHWLKRLFRALVSPFNELFISLKEVCLIFVPGIGGGRRNRDFDKAGRPQRVANRSRSTDAAFRQGERQRLREKVEADRESRKFATSKSDKAVHYREQQLQRKMDVSRGESVNHLAKVNAKHRQSAKQAAESDKPVSDKPAAEPDKTVAESDD